MPRPYAPRESINRSDRSTSPSLQRFGSLDLFNNLLFNRESVYRSFRRLSPIHASPIKAESVHHHSIESNNHIIPSVEVKEEEPMSRIPRILRSYKGPVTEPVSTPRSRPIRKTPAKAKSKGTSISRTKKRSPPVTSRSERAAKRQKTVPKANSGKRVNGRGASIADAFVISDDEDGSGLSRQENRTDSLTPPRQAIKVDSLDSEDDLKPIPVSVPAPAQAKDLEQDLARERATHARERDQLHLQLSASEAETQQVRAHAAANALAAHRKQSIAYEKALADLCEQLDLERLRRAELDWECDFLRREGDAARVRLRGEEELIQQRDELQRLHNLEKALNADLKCTIAARDEEAERRRVETEREMRDLNTRIEDLQRELTAVKAANTALQAPPPPVSEPPPENAKTQDSPHPSQPPPSASRPQPQPTTPSPSHFSAPPSRISRASSLAPFPSPSPSPLSPRDVNLETRLQNLRKTYVSTKKQYDNLRAVAGDIATATRGWELSSFGEFGGLLGQLGVVLGESGEEMGGFKMRGR